MPGNSTLPEGNGNEVDVVEAAVGMTIARGLTWEDVGVVNRVVRDNESSATNLVVEGTSAAKPVADDDPAVFRPDDSTAGVSPNARLETTRIDSRRSTVGRRVRRLRGGEVYIFLISLKSLVLIDVRRGTIKTADQGVRSIDHPSSFKLILWARAVKQKKAVDEIIWLLHHQGQTRSDTDVMVEVHRSRAGCGSIRRTTWRWVRVGFQSSRWNGSVTPLTHAWRIRPVGSLANCSGARLRSLRLY